MAKKKKDKPKYDENGKWVDQDARVLSGIRRAYRLSPQMQEALADARVELPPEPLKNGKPGKRVRVRFKCAACEGLFPQKSGKTTCIQVDHIEPATPLWTSVKEMTWDEVVKGIFCGVDNLQVLCSIPMKKNDGKPSCHAKKSAEENYIRKLIKADLEEEPNLIGLFKHHPDRDKFMERYKERYQEFLLDKAEKEAAKAERKRIREEKKAAKLKGK
jgi:hypothetical protein